MTSYADVLKKALKKKYGDDKNVIIDASQLKERERKIIPVSPTIDMAIGGGIVEGTWTILSGPPKCGKTVTSLQIAANAQRLYGKHIYYLNAEGRIKPRDIDGIDRLDQNNMTIIQSDTNAVLHAEDFLNISMDIIKNHQGAFIILDSASALCTTAEASKDITATGRADGPKLLASFCRQMAGIVPAQDINVIIIQHLIANTSGYGSPYIEDGGRKITYQVDTKLRCKSVKKWKVSESDKKQIGNILTWEVVCSSLGPPGNEAESYLLFGHGLDEEMELSTVGEDLGLISKGGAWYYPDWLYYKLDFLNKVCKTECKSVEEAKKEVKFCGKEKFKEFLASNPEVKEDLFTQIKKILE